MEIKLGQNFSVFKEWISLLKIAGEEHTLIANEETITVRSMDPSHVLLVDTTIQKALFEDYSLGDVPEKKVTINVNELSKVLDRIGKDEKVKLIYSEEKARFIVNSTKTGHRRNFELPVMDPLDSEVPEPKIFFKSKVRMIIKAVDIAIKDAMLVGDHVILGFNKEQASIKGEGDMGSSFSEWTKDSDDMLDLKSEEDSHATFTLTFISDAISAMKSLADVVAIELSTDMPLKAEAECTNQNVKVIVYLAPCII